MVMRLNSPLLLAAVFMLFLWLLAKESHFISPIATTASLSVVSPALNKTFVPPCQTAALLQVCYSHHMGASNNNVTNQAEIHPFHECIKHLLDTGEFHSMIAQEPYQPSAEEQAFREKLVAAETKERKVSMGAGGMETEGFLNSEREQLDLFSLYSWSHAFQQIGVNGIFTEHVLEHFTPTQIRHVASMTFLFLQPGGRFRIAVPDGYFPDDAFSTHIKAGSTPSGAGQNHMVVWTADTLPAIFAEMGFEIEMLEWCDMRGNFHSSWPPFTLEHGKVRRSIRFDSRNFQTRAFGDHARNEYSTNGGVPGISRQEYENKAKLKFVSLIFDAVKPAGCPVWKGLENRDLGN